MKKYILILVCMISGLSLFTSCEDLNPKAYDKISDNEFPKTENDLNTYLTGLYGSINDGPYGGGFAGIGADSRWCLAEATTDEFACSWHNGTWTGYSNFTWTSSDGTTTDWTFKQDVRNVSRCFIGLHYLDNIPGISPEKRKQFRAQFYTIAAMFAYSVYDNHGAFPIVTDPTILLDANSRYIPQRPSKEETIANIKKYAEIGLQDLPETYPASDYGHVTKGTALMILLKLAMHEKDWQEAMNLTDQFISMEGRGVYTLEKNYLDIFSAEHKQSKEIILAAPMLETNSERYNCWLANVMPPGYVNPDGVQPAAWNGYKVPWNMYDKYWDKTGKKPYPNPECNDIKDTRLQAIWDSITVYANGKDATDGYKRFCYRDSAKSTNPDWVWASEGAIPYKYPVDPKGSGSQMGNDWVIFRYADVLLYRAEAAAQLGNSSEAIDMLNRIRGRAQTTTFKGNPFKNKQELLNFILDERFRELFMEGVRREDMIRNNTYIQAAKDRGASLLNGRELFPIPQYVINQCGSAFPQNPGY